ncbi:flagellar filament capping protein FliD [Gallaecimonas sp. GXIMD4217]|uniref:flagellar filament capping protein FliD n=1 Tax=Gallaecimonas sp. GXIMD4217 TaxID=3131927 RepID=UPI00311AE2C6
MAVTLSGIGSGNDFEGLIETLVHSEKSPKVNLLNTKELQIQTELSGVGTLKSALSKFQSAVEKLADLDNFDKNTSTISYSADPDNPPISVGSASLVAAGSFEVKVQQLAKGSRMESAALGASTDTVGSGTLTLGAGSDSFDVTIDASDTLEDIRDKINGATGNFGVQANIINSDAGAVLVFNSSVTGDGNSLSVSTSDASLDSISTNLTQTKSAQSGIISVDGQTITSDSNTFTDAVGGLSLTALAETGTNSATLTVEPDTESVKTMLEDFVSSYNELKDQLITLSEPTNGALAFNPMVRQIQQELSKVVGDSVSGVSNTNMDSLYEAGITLTNDGHLEISSIGLGSSASGLDRLNDALANNMADLGALFASENGVAAKFDSFLEQYTGSSGLISERQKSLNESMADIEEQREDLDRYIESFELTLRNKFTALDGVLAQMNATQSYITSIFASLPKNDS